MLGKSKVFFPLCMDVCVSVGVYACVCQTGENVGDETR